MISETDEERRKRERQRLLFDEIAGLYDTTRRSYPSEIIDAVARPQGSIRAPQFSRSAVAPAS